MRNGEGLIKVHLGCADKRLPGYVHVDARKLPGIDHVALADDLPFEDGSVALIYWCHGLEHVRRADVVRTLKELLRVLAPGGFAFLSMPDYDALHAVQVKTGNLELVSPALYGGQDYPDNFHFDVYNFAKLQAKLTVAGFASVMRFNPVNLLPAGFVDYSTYHIAGVPISLNVAGRKAGVAV